MVGAMAMMAIMAMSMAMLTHSSVFRPSLHSPSTAQDFHCFCGLTLPGATSLPSPRCLLRTWDPEPRHKAHLLRTWDPEPRNKAHPLHHGGPRSSPWTRVPARGCSFTVQLGGPALELVVPSSASISGPARESWMGALEDPAGPPGQSISVKWQCSTMQLLVVGCGTMQVLICRSYSKY